MSTKYVRETAAGKSLSAYLITKGTKEVATVLSHYSDGGTVLVNVFQRDEAAKRTAKAINKRIKPRIPTDPADYSFQHAKTGGGGYDKFTAAITGMWIDGHELSDHCGSQLKPPNGRKTWERGTKPPKGYQFANFISQYLGGWGGADKRLNPSFQGEEGYQSCFRREGLKYLEAIGYTVRQVL